MEMKLRSHDRLVSSSRRQRSLTPGHNKYPQISRSELCSYLEMKDSGFEVKGWEREA